MRKIPLAFALLLITPLLAAQQPQNMQDSNAGQQAVPGTPPPPDTLLDGTPIKMRLSQTMSSADAKVGQEVPFEVLEDVSVNQVVVLPKGAPAIGTVTEAQSKKSMGRAGKLDITINYARLKDQEKVALRATQQGKGRGHVGAMTGAIVATSIVFFPAAPLFLFIHGKDITIPQGTEITAFVEGDMHLNMANFGGVPTSMDQPSQPNFDNAPPPPPAYTPLPPPEPAPAPAEPPAQPAPPVQPPPPANVPLSEPGSGSAQAGATMSSLDIHSTPSNADVEVDGAFVGSTPSTIEVSPGIHRIVLKKKGYTEWNRSLTVSGSTIHINAELDKATE